MKDDWEKWEAPGTDWLAVLVGIAIIVVGLLFVLGIHPAIMQWLKAFTA